MDVLKNMIIKINQIASFTFLPVEVIKSKNLQSVPREPVFRYIIICKNGYNIVYAKRIPFCFILKNQDKNGEDDS